MKFYLLSAAHIPGRRARCPKEEESDERKVPLGADKMGHGAWEFARNQQQPEVCSLIRLEVMLFQSEKGRR